MDKDNQELEKFKYVLHYKIKELKHNKEPKERKIIKIKHRNIQVLDLIQEKMKIWAKPRSKPNKVE